ncbi:hypothetical protein TWF481_010912 [Arthrobotrys musiformis]|uniref:Wbp11/ELF5/Saf1 N-terminal domain-containing protein n=1 Tax=Arthrobotrys musiformis TaxID=47236 RepID=A0AAV9VZQ3_9PEZI
MPKERSINPAAAHLKSEKAKALAKSRGQRQQQRQEKLARRNPDRLQRQIDELKDKETKGLALSTHEKKTLEELERDVKAVKKAREALGVPQEQERGQRGDRGKADRGRGGFRGRGSSRGGFDGRQRRDGRAGDDGGDSDSSTASSVAEIPLPTGPPPLKQLQIGRKDAEPLPAHLMGLPSKPGVAGAETGPPKAPQPVVTTYSSAPVMRDLRKEAAVFMPAAVQRQKKVVDAIEKIKRDAEDLNIDDE